MLNLIGYQDTEILYSGTRTLVYRATRLSDAQPVIIKVLRTPHPHFEELVQFRNQYVITQNLVSPAIVRPLALERYGNGHALIMPDDGAVSLMDDWQGNSPVSSSRLQDFLKIAIQLAQALHTLNQHHIIHKDIKPANILIHPQTRQVQLIDFSIATLLPREQRHQLHPQELEGALAYLAPEQTGRMNRGIDYRTDFYGLGVTLYELLTGMLPFTVSDPLALVHCHIAQMPTAPVDLLDAQGQRYPAMLSAIIMKLMAKNAEDRYQSALGLQHDLERCLRSLESTGQIAEFELGERDMCDRFLIPEKLYGREAEVQTLLDAFDRVAQGNRELLLVAGFSGIGKTAVVNEVHKPIVRQQGYFIKGKFDQFNRNIPFSAFVQALRELMGQLLSETDEALAQWQANILTAVGENGQVLIDVIPELERVIGQQPDAPELSGAAAQNRFNVLFQKFIAVFTTPEHPLVIFLDDLQWADSASLTLMKVLMGESEQGYLLVLGAYRDNEVFPAHPLMLTLGELDKERAAISTITLTPLPQTEINRLVAETLNCPSELAQPLTELVYQKTQGNPFFTTQFLKGLYDDDLILFNRDLGYWECDLVQVRDATLTDDVVAFMAGRLQKLPQATQDVLKLAACIGNQFDLATLAIVCQADPEAIAANLWPALQEGLILPVTEAYKFFQGESQPAHNPAATVRYRFLHDRIQQAADRLIPAEQKQQTHYRIGHRLLDQTPDPQASPRLFDITNHLNQAQDLLTTLADRWELVQLNVYAGQAARAGTAYQAAFDYLAQGLTVLPAQGWQDNYALTLKLHQDGAIAAVLVGEYERLDQWTGVALEQTQTVLDRVPCYEAQIQALVAQKQLPEAIQLGIDTLDQLGASFSQTPPPEAFPQGIAAIADLLGDREIEDLLTLPPLDDPQSLAILRVLFRLSAVLVLAAPQLMPFCMFKAVELSIRLGNSILSAPAYTTYGMILCGAVGDVPTGYRFGQLGLNIIERYQGKALQPKTLVRFQAGVRHWQDPLQDTLEPLAQGYQLALEVGDWESAAICAEVYGYHAYFSGQELTQLEAVLKTYSQGIQAIGQQTMWVWNEACRQQVLNLLGQSDDPTHLSGEAYDEALNLPQQQAYKDGFGLGMVYLHQGVACYCFEQLEAAIEHLTTAAQFFPSFAPFAAAPVFHFYTVLAHLAVLPTAQAPCALEFPPPMEQSYGQLQNCARYAPMNHQHKLELVMAERYRVLGQRHDAMDAYDRAIAAAQANAYIQEEALANERAAQFYLDWGKTKIASVYLQAAYTCYAQWGARAKTNALEAAYPQLLQPILQQQQPSWTILDTLGTIARPPLSSYTSQTADHTSSLGLNASFDLSAILESSQALSELLDFEQLLTQLSQLILQNSGGDRCALVLQSPEDIWQLRAIGTLDTVEICHTPLDGNSELPCKLIQYVKNTQEVLTIDGLKTALPVVDDYLQTHQPQSIICLPILHHQQLKGVLYVSNSTTQGVFGRDRLVILNFLCTQAAISLENARLFAHQKQAEIELQQNNAFLEAQRESSFNGILVTNTNRQISAFNQRFLDIWQIPQALAETKEDDKLLGFALSQLVDPQEFIDKVNYLYEQSTVVSHDEIFLKDGRILERITNPVRLPSGEYCGRIWSFQDISDRKRLEQDQQRLNAILEASSDYIALADPQGQLLWLNQEFQQLFPDRTAETLHNFKVSDFHPAWVNEIIFNTGLPIAIEQGTWLAELAVLNAAGQEIPVSVLVIAHKSDQGVVKYFSAIMRNISQQKQNEQALVEKSQELEVALQDLTQAQLQMVQSEKMSALGNLVAGVAHEINNPVGFLKGNIQPAQDYVQDLLDLIDLLLTKTPNHDLQIQDEVEAIDLEFVRQDLPKLINSMNTGVERIRNISNSLRTFSRKDQEHKTAFNLHDGIESTLLILKHRTKANEQRPQVEIIKNYGELTEVQCFPGQLNQVFMNILANAIDAFDEVNQGRTYQEIEANPNTITIATSVVDEQVQIQIQDNGCGMKPETVERIFEQGFTTKEVGKGTGLGMAIAHQIITEKHEGAIICTSKLSQGTGFIISLPIS